MEIYRKITFAFCVFILGLAALYFIYSNKLNGPIIRSDGEGYYAYLLALFIYHDITLRTQIAGFHTNIPQGAIHWKGTNKYIIRYSCGEANSLLSFSRNLFTIINTVYSIKKLLAFHNHLESN